MQQLLTPQLTELAEGFARYSEQTNIAYTIEQLNRCAYCMSELFRVSGDKPKTMLIVDDLMETAYLHFRPIFWDWIREELRFEIITYVETNGDHYLTARAMLNCHAPKQKNNEVLDQYNERMLRFASSPELYGQSTLVA